MTATHTPGPWWPVAPGAANSDTADHWEIHDGFGRTATVYGETDDPETQANARLIAAAPDLLAALLGIVKLYESDPDDLETMDAGINLAAAAIAQATEGQKLGVYTAELVLPVPEGRVK